MLDINPPNSDLDTVAGWVLGTSLVIMVAAAVILGNVWTGGKAFGSARLTSRGQTGVVLVVIACVILASISGAIKYSTKDSMTEDLLPEAAKQRTIRVDRESPSSKCEELVSIASDKHLDGKKDKADDEQGMQYKPTEAEAGKMGKAIREIGADKMAADKVWTKYAGQEGLEREPRQVHGEAHSDVLADPVVARRDERQVRQQELPRSQGCCSRSDLLGALQDRIGKQPRPLRRSKTVRVPHVPNPSEMTDHSTLPNRFPGPSERTGAKKGKHNALAHH